MIPYKDVNVIDIHNHDAGGKRYLHKIKEFKKYSIDKVVLFGDISCKAAIRSDKNAYEAYQKYPDRFYPFIAGINIHDSSCLTYIKERFEKGVYGIGEVVGASTYAPIASSKEWKGEHPLDGYFPEIYKLCAEYNKPIMLHLDPPFGMPIEKLFEAATLYPQTNFIFAHANAYNSPDAIRLVLEAAPNIYIDFFAGFTAYSPNSDYSLADFVELILNYPDRFMVSSDSAIDLDYDKAYSAIYELFALIDNRSVIEKIAGENFLGLIE